MSSPNDDQRQQKESAGRRLTPPHIPRRPRSERVGAGSSSSSASGSGAGAGDHSPPPPPPSDRPKGVGRPEGASERLEKSTGAKKGLTIKIKTSGEGATAEGSKAGQRGEKRKRNSLDKKPSSFKASSTSGTAAGQLPVQGSPVDAAEGAAISQLPVQRAPPGAAEGSAAGQLPVQAAPASAAEGTAAGELPVEGAPVSAAEDAHAGQLPVQGAPASVAEDAAASQLLAQGSPAAAAEGASAGQLLVQGPQLPVKEAPVDAAEGAAAGQLPVKWPHVGAAVAAAAGQLPLQGPQLLVQAAPADDAEGAADGQLPEEGVPVDAPREVRTCSVCRKQFGNWKALFGHLRSHPNRTWRGAYPPPVSTPSPPTQAEEQAKELASSLLEIGQNILKNMNEGESSEATPVVEVVSSSSLDLNQPVESPETAAERRRMIHAELDLNLRLPEMDDDEEEEEEEEEAGGTVYDPGQ